MTKKLSIKKNFKLYILLAAVFIILAFGFQQQTKPAIYPSPTPNNSNKLSLMPPNLTGEEKFILFPPPADASKSAKEKHAQTISKLAKIGNTIEIKNCQPSPLVLQVVQNSEFTINNNDDIEHTITIDEEHKYKIPARGNLKIKSEFKHGPGDYGYICEQAGLVGFLHVTPK